MKAAVFWDAVPPSPSPKMSLKTSAIFGNRNPVMSVYCEGHPGAYTHADPLKISGNYMYHLL
jgi:hypothetical protein